MSELKSCPFCGGEAEIKYSEWTDSCDPPERHHVWSVGCARHATHTDCCPGRLCMNRGYKNRDEAIDAWNTRAGSGECELVETESYSNAYEVIHVLECSACGETCEHVNGAYPRCPHCGARVREAVER